MDASLHHMVVVNMKVRNQEIGVNGCGHLHVQTTDRLGGPAMMWGILCDACQNDVLGCLHCDWRRENNASGQ
jgi:hypothetical protein